MHVNAQNTDTLTVFTVPKYTYTHAHFLHSNALYIVEFNLFPVCVIQIKSNKVAFGLMDHEGQMRTFAPETNKTFPTYHKGPKTSHKTILYSIKRKTFLTENLSDMVH